MILGKLAGTVSTSGLLRHQPGSVADATVFLESSGGDSFTLQTDANGYYQRWLSDGGNPYNGSYRWMAIPQVPQW